MPATVPRLPSSSNVFPCVCEPPVLTTRPGARLKDLEKLVNSKEVSSMQLVGLMNAHELMLTA